MVVAILDAEAVGRKVEKTVVGAVVERDAAVTWSGPSRAASAAWRSYLKPDRKKRVDDLDVDCNSIGCKTAAAFGYAETTEEEVEDQSYTADTLSPLAVAAAVDHSLEAAIPKARRRQQAGPLD